MTIKKILFFAFALLASCSFLDAQSVTVVKVSRGSKTEKMTIELVPQEDYLRLHIPASELKNVAKVELREDFATARTGEEGFFLTPEGLICRFTPKADGEHKSRFYPMPMWGTSTPAGTYLAIAKGLRYEFNIKTVLKDGIYRQIQYYDLKECGAYEDLIVDWYPLKGDDATYSGMGRRYRKYQLDRGEVKPIKERIKKNHYLDYAVQAPEIRIRMGWKPVPTPVNEQTLETEPEMYVATNFKRVGNLVDELKKRGVSKAEICLVGWNVKGHDGRWPTAFPVESAFGGEKQLKKLIAHGRKCCYQMVCHSNACDCYTISPDLDTTDIARSATGKRKVEGNWSGGRMYLLCPQKSYEKYSRKTHSRLRQLGFRGLHYIDVLSCGRPRPCYHPGHPLNREESAVYETKILADAASKFGGAQSEGPFDQSASVLDYVYKVQLPGSVPSKESIIDGYVPIWNIVYNGIILSNPGGGSNNFPVSGKNGTLKVLEVAGRPTFYLYQTFRSGTNWSRNLMIGTDAEMKKTADYIAEAWKVFQDYSYLLYEFMEDHSTIAPSVTRSVFSDGSEVICNKSKEAFLYKDKPVAPMGYGIYR